MNLLYYIPGFGTVCPFCLERIPRQKKLATCPNEKCGKELPVLYMSPGENLSHLPVQVFGWSQHGKTAYLAALTLMLMKMNRIWKSFTWLAVTEASQNKERDVNIYSRQGIMPPPTPMGADDCYVMLLRKMVPWRSRALLVRDCPGEIFKDFKIPLDQAPFIQRSRTIFMFASLPDLLEPEADNRQFEGWTMNMLIASFLNTLESNHIRLKGRRIVMVLTKGDRITDLSPKLRNYLVDDILWAAANSAEPERILQRYLGRSSDFSIEAFMERYLEEMKEIDAEIRRWLNLDYNAQAFIDLAQHYGVELRLSLTSATGGPTSPGSGLAQRWEPRRVLDPFFWALELERKGTTWAYLAGLWSSLTALTSRAVDGMRARSKA